MRSTHQTGSFHLSLLGNDGEKLKDHHTLRCIELVAGLTELPGAGSLGIRSLPFGSGQFGSAWFVDRGDVPAIEIGSGAANSEQKNIQGLDIVCLLT